MKKILITTLIMASLASCQKSEEHTIEGGGSSEVTFVSGISTRATANLWDEGDKIGVFMYETGSTLTSKNSSNVEYTLDTESGGTSTGNFTSTNPLYFLQFSNVDFVAYYPYTDSVEDGAVSISTADQTSSEKFEALDFMVARATDCNETDGNPSLSFERKMSRIVITVERKDSKANAVISELAIRNIATEGTYTFDNGADNGVEPTSTLLNIALFEDESNQIEAIIVPQNSTSATLFMLIDGEYTTASISRNFEAGMQYNYKLSIGDGDDAGDAGDAGDTGVVVDFTAGTITDWNEVESGDMEPTVFPSYTASEISHYNVPSVDTWIITDSEEITSDLMSGVIDALDVATSSGREITIILPNATSIGNQAFVVSSIYNISSLVSIELPNVTSIGISAFYARSSLTNVDMPKVETIADVAFGYCTNLTTISDLSGITSIGEGAFFECSALETDVKLLKITELPNHVFCGCTNLKSVEIPEVTSIGESTFNGCTSLVSVDISGVTSLGIEAFSSCSSLAIDLYMPDITTIPYAAFGACKNLKSVNLPNVEVVEDSAFVNCASITEVNLPSATSIGNGVFYCVDLLTTLKLTTESAITCGTDIFGGSGSSSTVTLYISQVNSSVTNLTDGTYSFKEIIYND